MTISIRHADRHRDQYRAELWIDGQHLGTVEKGFVQGGIGGTDYLARVAGILVAQGRTLRDLREELSVWYTEEYLPSRGISP